MDDVQNRPDDRGIPIDKVGVSNLRYPIVVLDRNSGRQNTASYARLLAKVVWTVESRS